MRTDKGSSLAVVWIRTLPQTLSKILAVLLYFFLEGMSRASGDREVLQPTVSRDR